MESSVTWKLVPTMLRSLTTSVLPPAGTVVLSVPAPYLRSLPVRSPWVLRCVPTRK